jgi:site-specific recombinase XerD
MQKLVDAYWKELFDVAGYAFATVENYVRCLEKYFGYARNTLEIDPLEAGPKQLLQWMTHLKEQKLSRSTLIHHKAALKHFFSRSFGIVRLGRREHNPADTLFTIRKKKSELNQPISKDVAFQLLRSVDRATWLDERNFMIISILWALGLRISELTSLKVGIPQRRDGARSRKQHRSLAHSGQRQKGTGAVRRRSALPEPGELPGASRVAQTKLTTAISHSYG